MQPAAMLSHDSMHMLLRLERDRNDCKAALGCEATLAD